MTNRIQSTSREEIIKPLGRFMMAGAAAIAFTIATPASAEARNMTISVGDMNFGDDDKDLLQQLIELDAAEIEELRQELVEAREEIADAVIEIEEAREEVKSVPGGGAILKVAFSAARSTVSKSTEEAFEEVRAELDQAELELAASKGEVSAEEFTETQGAIDMLRAELAEVEVALAGLMDALKA